MATIDLDSEDTHQQTCALYLLGALDPEAEAEFERHLAGCLPCLDDSERLGPMLGGMAMLLGADLGIFMREHDTVVGAHGAVVGGRGRAVRRRSPWTVAPQRVARPPARPGERRRFAT